MLYCRGLYEMAEYSFRAAFRNTDGLTFDTFDEKNNDMDIMFIIFLLEWPIFMLSAWYLEQVIASGAFYLLFAGTLQFQLSLINNQRHKALLIIVN